MRRASLWLYRAAIHLLLPVAAPVLLWQAARKGKKRPSLRHRLAWGLPPVPPGGVVLHAVSVGEVTVARALAAELRRRHPALPLVFTATTATGLALASGAQLADATLPFPLDLPGPTRRFLQLARPRLLLLVETELWPEMLAACGEVGVPVVVVNARISDRSFPRYRRLRRVLRTLLEPVTLALAQTPQDAQRLQELGIPEGKVRVTGNLKFDVGSAQEVPEALRQAVAGLAGGRAVVVAGSTMAGEEEKVLEAFTPLREKAFLLLAPRHPERAGEVLELCMKAGLNALRRSPLPPAGSRADVLVLDTVGELAALYQLASVAFVGGSLVPTGGHNPIEPARFAVPILSGPRVHNFAAVYQELCAQGGALLVANPSQLRQKLAYFLEYPDAARQVGLAAQAMLQRHRGATARTLEALEPFLP